MTQYVSTILLLYTIMFTSSTCIYFDFIYERCITVLISYMAVNNRVFAVGLFYFNLYFRCRVLNLNALPLLPNLLLACHVTYFDDRALYL